MDGVLVEAPALGVFGQMALDEALADSKPEAFCLRFYRWEGPAATFGYAQRIHEVERVLPAGIGNQYTRRPTGGGLVPHLADLTFSCVFPAAGELRPAELYRRLHAAILKGLQAVGVAGRLCAAEGEASASRPGGAGQCFVQPVAQDILSAAGKILGGAIKRSGDTVLYQGSLQLPDARARAPELETALAGALAAEWGLRWRPQAPADSVQAAARGLETKYRAPEWIRKF